MWQIPISRGFVVLDALCVRGSTSCPELNDPSDRRDAKTSSDHTLSKSPVPYGHDEIGQSVDDARVTGVGSLGRSRHRAETDRLEGRLCRPLIRGQQANEGQNREAPRCP